MQFRAAPALSIPALMTVLVAIQARPPQWMVAPAPPPPPPPPAPAPVVRAAPRVKRVIPKILAVDSRIKKRVQKLRPSIRKRLAHVAKKLPDRVTLLVTSAYRTYNEQKKLIPTFGVKAKPGRSPHEDGRAIDVNVMVDGDILSPRKNRSVIGKVMAEAGFKHLGAIDPVHYSVPKHEIGKVSNPPVLDVMTMDEAREVLLQERLAESLAAELDPEPAP